MLCNKEIKIVKSRNVDPRSLLQKKQKKIAFLLDATMKIIVTEKRKTEREELKHKTQYKENQAKTYLQIEWNNKQKLKEDAKTKRDKTVTIKKEKEKIKL